MDKIDESKSCILIKEEEMDETKSPRMRNADITIKEEITDEIEPSYMSNSDISVKEEIADEIEPFCPVIDIKEEGLPEICYDGPIHEEQEEEFIVSDEVGPTSSERDNETAPKKMRRNEEKYRRNVIRTSKVRGVEHINWAGRLILSRTTGAACNCKLQCFTKFSDDEKSEFVASLSQFKSKDEQDIFLQQLIEKHAIKHRRPRSEQPRETAASFKYFLLYRGERKRVCKIAFISFYGITEGRVRRLTDLLLKGKLPQDKRGKNPKKNTISAEVCSKIHEHISSFPTTTTYYGTKDISYLDARLDIKKMHSLFEEKYPDLGVKYEFYLAYFHANFSLRFGRPQVDRCLHKM
ncbi:unnamed protein product [Nezara viridula]|uniref:Uncharacterized protein n=1 Tax=Nezara viridula TaxID=85310 RepID=A0A9P0E9K2_NEZVI|nr:unnamed protein product [Nezara viridula]